MRRVLVRAVGAALWGLVLALVLVLLLSVYPAYIQRGNYGTGFRRAKELADRLVGRLVRDAFGHAQSLQLNGATIAISSQHQLPPLIDQPVMMLVKPEDLSDKLYFKKPTHPVVYHTMMTPDPFTTYAPVPGDVAGLVHHNREQFRYPVDLGPKQPGEVRVFITGGSVAWGALASDTDATIAGSLERRLRARYPGREVKVITAAAGAWSTTQERTWILNRITEYEPDLIVSYSGNNDVRDVCRRRDDLFDRYWYDGAYYLHAIQGYELYNRGPGVAALIRPGPPEHFTRSDCPRKTLKNVEIVTAYLHTIGVPYVYVLQPIRVGAEAGEAVAFEVLARHLGELAPRDGFQFIDHSHLLDGRRELFYDGCHVGDVGNDLIAGDLLGRIDWDAVMRGR